LYVDHFEGRKAVEIIERIYDNWQKIFKEL
jgi:hypothetical protein